MSSTSISHYIHQSKFLTDMNNCPVFDYVGRLEYFDEDLLRIILEIERRYHQQQQDGDGDAHHDGPTPLLEHYHSSIGANKSGRISASKGTSFGKKREEKMVATGENKGSGITAMYSDEEIVEKISSEYELDFRLFGYSKKDVPGREWQR